MFCNQGRPISLNQLIQVMQSLRVVIGHALDQWLMDGDHIGMIGILIAGIMEEVKKGVQ